MNKSLSLSFGHDAWGPQLKISHMIPALLQEMSYLSSAVQGNHLSAAGTSFLLLARYVPNVAKRSI